jgi:hypothetical protein
LARRYAWCAIRRPGHPPAASPSLCQAIMYGELATSTASHVCDGPGAAKNKGVMYRSEAGAHLRHEGRARIAGIAQPRRLGGVGVLGLGPQSPASKVSSAQRECQQHIENASHAVLHLARAVYLSRCDLHHAAGSCQQAKVPKLCNRLHLSPTATFSQLAKGHRLRVSQSGKTSQGFRYVIWRILLRQRS